MTPHRHTSDGLQALLWAEQDAGRPAHIEPDAANGRAWLVVRGRRTGDYAEMEGAS